MQNYTLQLARVEDAFQSLTQKENHQQDQLSHLFSLLGQSVDSWDTNDLETYINVESVERKISFVNKSLDSYRIQKDYLVEERTILKGLCKREFRPVVTDASIPTTFSSGSSNEESGSIWGLNLLKKSLSSITVVKQQPLSPRHSTARSSVLSAIAPYFFGKDKVAPPARMDEKSEYFSKLAYKESQRIDEEIQKVYQSNRSLADEKNTKNKIILLGSADSGKSTALKQMRILSNDPFTDSERLIFREGIFENNIATLRILLHIAAISQINLEMHDEITQKLANVESKYTIEDTKQLNKFWQDPEIQKIFSSSSTLLHDSTRYFLDKLIEISDPLYELTNIDILSVRMPTSEIQIHDLELYNHKISVVYKINKD